MKLLAVVLFLAITITACEPGATSPFVAIENVFGALWTRPGLDLKTRTLICVVSDAATGREPELELHLHMALRQGWSEEELTETLVHLSGYVGVPLIRGAMLVASKVFAQLKEQA